MNARLDQLGQLVSVRENVRRPPLTPHGRFRVRELTPADFERGPDAVAFPLQFDIGGSVFPWIAALPRAQAIVAGETALALISGVRSTVARDARLLMQTARRGAFTPAKPAGWTVLSAAVMRAMAAALPDVVARFSIETQGILGTPVPPESTQLFATMTAWLRRWWALVMRRLAFADVARASITLTRTPRGVIVRPAILGGQLDGDFALLAGCFGGAS